MQGMEHRVGSMAEIPDDRCLVVECDGVAVGVIRQGERVFAYENRCVHQGGPVCRGEVVGRLRETCGPDRAVIETAYDADEPLLACPWHGWEYELGTGICVADRRFRLRSFPVRIEGGEVYVAVERA